MSRIVCGVCLLEGRGYVTAIEVEVTSGELRIRTWLCPDCMAKAEDGRHYEMAIFQSETPPDSITRAT